MDHLHTRVDQVYVGLLNLQEHVAGHFGTVYTRLDGVITRLVEGRGAKRG